MRQSNVIFGTILLAFVIYITERGQLPMYLDLFKKKDSTGAGSSSGGGLFSDLLGKLGGTALNAAGKALGASLPSLSSGSTSIDDGSSASI